MFLEEPRACPVSKVYRFIATIFAAVYPFWPLLATCDSYSCPPILPVALPDKKSDRDMLEMPPLCKKCVLRCPFEDVILITVLIDEVLGKGESSTVVFQMEKKKKKDSSVFLLYFGNLKRSECEGDTC